MEKNVLSSGPLPLHSVDVGFPFNASASGLDTCSSRRKLRASRNAVKRLNCLPASNFHKNAIVYAEAKRVFSSALAIASGAGCSPAFAVRA